jgi:WD40 repeat protein
MSERDRASAALQRLASRLLDEQRARWERGDEAPAEEFLRQHPELQADPEALVDLIYQEVLLQQERGRAQRLSDCVRRFPQCEALLTAQFALHEVLQSSRWDGPLPPPGPPAAPGWPAVPGYELRRELGSGGMGVVYLAEDLALKRPVAIKLIRNGPGARREGLARFRTEAEAVARLHHPNLAQVYGVGEHNGGPYLVLEYVEGGSLERLLDGRPQPPRDAACLVEALARAVHHAHENGVVHRDLKPANILLRRKAEARRPPPDDRPRLSDFDPKVTDFGLAKFLAGGARLTSTGAVLGTPGYMPPEQIRGEAERIGPATDVYALGAVLYELLTGRLPFQGAGEAEILLRALTEDPVPPRRVQPRVPRDLETICLKCLESRPGRRYTSAQALAADLARFLGGEPVAARPAGGLGRALKWARRRPAVAALAAAVVAVTAVAFGTITGQWRAAEGARRDAEAAALRADAARAKEAEERRRYQRLSLGLAVDRGRRLCEDGEAGRGLLQLARCLEWAREGQEDWQPVIRGNLGAWTESLCALRECLPHQGRVLAAAWGPDGRLVLTGCADGRALLWDATTGEPAGAALTHPARVNAVAFSPDGRLIATATGDPGRPTGGVWLWDAVSRRPVAGPLAHPGPVWAVAFSPDGRAVVTGCTDPAAGGGAVRVWDAATGAPRGAPLPHARAVRAVAFSPDGRTVLSGSEDRSARLWDAATGAPLQAFKHKGYVQAVAFSPDGTTVATASRDATVRLWDVGTGKPVGEPLRDAGYAEAVAFSPDGKVLVTGSRDGMARLWEVKTGKLVANVLPHRDQVTAVAFAPQGRTILTGSFDGSARLWELPPAGSALTLAHPNQVWAAAVSPDGRTAATGSSNGLIKFWDVSTGRLVGQPLAAGGPVQSLAYRPDGAVLVTGGDDRAARLWDVATGAPVGAPLGHPAAVTAVAFRPDGRAVLTGCRDRKARLWDTAGPGVVEATLPHPAPVNAVAFHPKDPHVVLTGCADGKARLWDATQGRCLRTFGPHLGAVRCVAFGPDGRSVVTGGEDRTARLWDTATGGPVGEPLTHQGAVQAVAFSPDGAMLLTAGRDRKARLWDVASRKSLGPPRLHQAPVRAGVFHPDGRSVLTASEDMTARLWPLPAATGGDAERVVARVQVLTGLELDGSGTVHVLDASSWRERRRALR